MKGRKRALITGISGQDGSYLAEWLLDNGYDVFGLTRRVTLEDETNRLSRISHIIDQITLLTGSLDSYPSLYRALRNVKPHEVYHLAAQSFVDYTFEDEFSTMNVNINGTHGLLAACLEVVPDTKFYFAGSSEMFGKTSEVPQVEATSFRPRSAYGISKVAGFHLTTNFRDNYGLFGCSGILYNHESPRRGFEFVTRKISSAAAKIKKGMTDKLRLGNLDARRDWGHAKEYVKAMWLMLQRDLPDDYIICTGQLHSVREFCEVAFDYVGLNYKDYVVADDRFYREEKQILKGDCSKARESLQWKSETAFKDLVVEMVEHDLKING